MIPVSSWYTQLSIHTFPTLFIGLNEQEAEALAAGEQDGKYTDAVVKRINQAIRLLPGSIVIHADVCAPTDSPLFQKIPACKSGRQAWRMLTSSAKVVNAVKEGKTRRLGLHSYRRLDPIREFRMFIKDGELKAMSQMRLERHYRRLEGRKPAIWKEGLKLCLAIHDFLPSPDLTIDVYFTSDSELMIIDMNLWGDPTEPLLLKSWDRDWKEAVGLRTIPPPFQMKGNVEVNF